MRKKVSGESSSLGVLGPAGACQPTAAKTLEQKDHLLEEEERGGGMKGGGTLYRGI